MGEVAERAGASVGACATTRDHAARHGRHPCAAGGLGDPGTTRGQPRVHEPRGRARFRHRVMINLGAGNGSIGPQGWPRSRYC